MSPVSAFEEAVDIAFRETVIYGYRLQYALQKGEKIPRRFMPGVLIERLSEQTREALKLLTSDMIKDNGIWVVKEYGI